MSIVVISQPMFFPWLGLFEQLRLADIFVHYDDVQLPQGRTFISRVQIKMPHGTSWLTAPIDRKRSGKLINETVLVADGRWRTTHLNTLRHAYARAPHAAEMFELAEELYDCSSDNLATFNINAVETISRWFDLKTQFYKSSEFDIDGRSTQRLVSICRHFGASEYITGYGAANYLDHEAFEALGSKVSYMKYECAPYPQLHGPFTPYVSVLDLIANCGKEGRQYIRSGTVNWKEFMNGSN